MSRVIASNDRCAKASPVVSEDGPCYHSSEIEAFPTLSREPVDSTALLRFVG